MRIELYAGPAAAGGCTYQMAADAIRLIPRPAELPSYRDPQDRFQLRYPFGWAQRQGAAGADAVFEAAGGTSLLAARLLPSTAAQRSLLTIDPGTLFPAFVRPGATLSREPIIAHEDEVLADYTGTSPDGLPVAGAISLVRMNGQIYAGLYRTDPDRWYTERGYSYPVVQSMRPPQAAQ